MAKSTQFGISASTLRILALTLMLVDHLGYALFPQAQWMRVLGRLAFPIFAFQTAVGYRFTRNFWRYWGRLMVFGLISEIPFDLMLTGSPVYFWGQNVMFTLALGLLAIRFWDQKNYPALILVFLAAVLGQTDYGMFGVLMVLQFHVLRETPLAQWCAMALINGLGYGGIQIFAVGAMIPIGLYNGEKGHGGKALQYLSYCFYPAHMLILGLL